MTEIINVEQCLEDLYNDATYFHLVHRGYSKIYARFIVLRRSYA